jgi:hypothetical protein
MKVVAALVRLILRNLKLDSFRLTSYEQVLEVCSYFIPVATDHELIRVGNAGPGGYLVPNSLDGIRAIFSPGVAKQWTFEKDLHGKFGIIPFLADKAEDKPADYPEDFSYTPSWIGLSGLEGFLSLEEWVSLALREADPENDFGNNLMLQMDIEGGEYHALLAAPEDLLKRFRIIVLELHDTEAMLNPRIMSLVFHPLLRKLSTQFDVVHAHPNNCCGNWKYKDIEFPRVIEVTLMRKDRTSRRPGLASLPHSLDLPCVSGKKELGLNWRPSTLIPLKY